MVGEHSGGGMDLVTLLIALSSLVLLNVIPVSYAHARQQATSLQVEGGAGAFIGDPTSFEGVILYMKVERPTAHGPTVGLRAEFRDDDLEFGRVRAFGVGPELEFIFFTHPRRITREYIAVGTGLDLQFVSDQPSPEFRNVESGLFPRLSAGLGAELNLSGLRTRTEIRRVLSSGGSYWGATVGLSSDPEYRDYDPDYQASGWVLLTGGGFTPIGRTYQGDSVRTGYSISYQAKLPESRLTVRGTIGADFIEFGRFHTGVISALVGLPQQLHSFGDIGAFYVVPEIGALFFVEGADASTIPIQASLGLELHMGTRQARVLVATRFFGANGPAGTFVGHALRIGLALGV